MDPLEQEADWVADRVMAMSPNSGVSRTPPRVQRFTRQASGETGTAPASLERLLASPGRPLDPVLQQDMGQRFGYDFSRVRVHTGGEAEQSAQDVNARAYTVGKNIVFGTNRFAPESNDGRRLIAHELVHVVQQSAAPQAPVVQRAPTEASTANVSYDSMSLEEAIRHLGEMSQDQALRVLKRWQKYILNSINEGEGRIREYIKLRAESFSNYLIGGTIEFFGGTSIPSDDWKEPWRFVNAAYGAIASRQVAESAKHLSDAANATRRHWEQMHEFEDKFEAGAGRSILALQGLEVAGAVAITVLTAGQGTAVMVGAGSAYAGTQRFAGEATSMAIGTKDRIDFSGIAFDMIFAALMGKFLGPLCGKVANGVAGAIIKRVGEGAARQVLAKITAQFVASIIAGRASGLLHGVAFQIFNAVRGEKSLSMDDFMQMVADQLSADAFFLDTVGAAAGIAFNPRSVAPNPPKLRLVNTPPAPKAGGARPPGRAASEPSNVIPLRARGDAAALRVAEPTGASVPMARRGDVAALRVAEPAPVSTPAVEAMPAKPALHVVPQAGGPVPAPPESVAPTAVAISATVTQPKAKGKEKGEECPSRPNPQCPGWTWLKAPNEYWDHVYRYRVLHNLVNRSGFGQNIAVAFFTYDGQFGEITFPNEGGGRLHSEQRIYWDLKNRGFNKDCKFKILGFFSERKPCHSQCQPILADLCRHNNGEPFPIYHVIDYYNGGGFFDTKFHVEALTKAYARAGYDIRS